MMTSTLLVMAVIAIGFMKLMDKSMDLDSYRDQDYVNNI